MNINEIRQEFEAHGWDTERKGSGFKLTYQDVVILPRGANAFHECVTVNTGNASILVDRFDINDCRASMWKDGKYIGDIEPEALNS